MKYQQTIDRVQREDASKQAFQKDCWLAKGDETLWDGQGVQGQTTGIGCKYNINDVKDGNAKNLSRCQGGTFFIRH